MSLFFKQLIGFSEAGYVEVTIDISGPEQIELILSEGFIYRDGVTEAGSHAVTWKNATRGLAKECRDKAVGFWKTHLYKKIFYTAKNGHYGCAPPEPLFCIFSLEFEQDGFDVQAKEGAINWISWENAKFGKAMEMRNITEKSNN
jgi:hypothetical protein